jgi:aspartate/methionine/tyrosine aminotransferase
LRNASFLRYNSTTMSLSPFKLERFFAQYEFTTKYLMCSSDPESWHTCDILALEPGAQERYLNHWLGYTESNGAPTLRAQVSAIYTTIEPDDVLMFAGAEEGIFWFMHAALSAGDHFIVHTPCYQSHKEVARSIGAEVTEWQAKEELGWRLNADDLKALLRSNTRAVLITAPHNPTGYLMDAETFIAINRICIERGIVLFCDEVFRESELDPSLRLPAACDVNPIAISLGVISKTYGLPGLRIGWVATHNAALRQRMAALKDYSTICNSAPSEFLAEVALRHRQTLLARTVGILRSNLALLDDFFVRQTDSFRWVRPQASPMSFPKYLRGNIDALADRAARECGVLIAPGGIFDHGGDHFRLGFGRKNLPQALAVFEEWFISRARTE